jgi:hypothetical protein
MSSRLYVRRYAWNGMVGITRSKVILSICDAHCFYVFIQIWHWQATIGSRFRVSVVSVVRWIGHETFVFFIFRKHAVLVSQHWQFQPCRFRFSKRVQNNVHAWMDWTFVDFQYSWVHCWKYAVGNMFMSTENEIGCKHPPVNRRMPPGPLGKACLKHACWVANDLYNFEIVRNIFCFYVPHWS